MYRHRPACAAIIALMATTTTISACGSTASPSLTGGATRCPASAPALATPIAGTAAPDLPPGAETATICQYASVPVQSKAASAPRRRLVLRGQAADGLGNVLNEADPMTTQGARCGRAATSLPLEQLIYLRYRDGRTVGATVRFTSCQLAVVAAAGLFGLLRSPVQDDLFGYTMVAAQGRGTRVPDVIGLTAQKAASVARRQHVMLTVDGEVVDQAVRAGTIIFQVPPPATDFGLGPYSLGTIVSVRSAPDCLLSQLRLSYRAGGAGAGSDFGVILIRDVSASSCRLAGRLQVAGVNAAARLATSTVTVAIVGPGVLTPNMQPVGDTAPVPPGVLAWLLAAPYRDDPTSPSGLCTAHYVVPARWRVRLPDGSFVMVANADDGSPVRLSSSGGLTTCRGRLGAVSQVPPGG